MRLFFGAVFTLIVSTGYASIWKDNQALQERNNPYYRKTLALGNSNIDTAIPFNDEEISKDMEEEALSLLSSVESHLNINEKKYLMAQGAFERDADLGVEGILKQFEAFIRTIIKRLHPADQKAVKILLSKIVKE